MGPRQNAAPSASKKSKEREPPRRHGQRPASDASFTSFESSSSIDSSRPAAVGTPATSRQTPGAVWERRISLQSVDSRPTSLHSTDRPASISSTRPSTGPSTDSNISFRERVTARLAPDEARAAEIARSRADQAQPQPMPSTRAAQGVTAAQLAPGPRWALPGATLMRAHGELPRELPMHPAMSAEASAAALAGARRFGEEASSGGGPFSIVIQRWTPEREPGPLQSRFSPNTSEDESATEEPGLSRPGLTRRTSQKVKDAAKKVVGRRGSKGGKDGKK